MSARACTRLVRCGALGHGAGREEAQFVREVPGEFPQRPVLGLVDGLHGFQDGQRTQGQCPEIDAVLLVRRPLSSPATTVPSSSARAGVPVTLIGRSVAGSQGPGRFSPVSNPVASFQRPARSRADL
ncbi:MAG: hypothetical protein V9G10_03155 [Candidatus Nanopelagicales bacterium]